MTTGFSASARRLSAGIVAGLACGIAVGGVGGRIAMFILRLTSDPALHGMKTDDDFTIGRFSPETIFLVVVTAFLGVIGGIVYMAIRSRFPLKARPIAAGALGAAVGGATFIRPGGVDFTLVKPTALSLIMFVALPAVYGVLLAVLTERMLRSTSFFQTSKAWPIGLVPLVAIALFGIAGLALIAAMIIVWVVGLKVPAARRAWASTPAVWAGRAAVAGVVGYGAVLLAQDIVEVL